MGGVIFMVLSSTLERWKNALDLTIIMVDPYIYNDNSIILNLSKKAWSTKVLYSHNIRANHYIYRYHHCISSIFKHTTWFLWFYFLLWMFFANIILRISHLFIHKDDLIFCITIVSISDALSDWNFVGKNTSYPGILDVNKVTFVSHERNGSRSFFLFLWPAMHLSTQPITH